MVDSLIDLVARLQLQNNQVIMNENESDCENNESIASIVVQSNEHNSTVSKEEQPKPDDNDCGQQNDCAHGKTLLSYSKIFKSTVENAKEELS